MDQPSSGGGVVTEFLIVGSGAGGSAAAYALAQAGRRVLLVEQGPELPEDGSTSDPQVTNTGRFRAQERWIDARGGTVVPEEYFNVGGKTRWYGAALLRMERAEFAAEPALGLTAWPFGYDELVPWYEAAEKLLDVRLFPDEAELRRFEPALARRGWGRQPLQLGLSADIAQHPWEETHFDGYAIPDGLKGDARFHLLDPLRGLPHFSLLADARVDALLSDAGDPARVAGVRLADGRELRARHVILSGGTLHSPRLLQRYLAATGLDRTLPGAAGVGRQFKRHILTAVIGFRFPRKQDRLCKTALFVHADYVHSSVQPLGGWADAETVRAVLPAFLPRWLKNLFANHCYGFFLQTEDGSHPDNRVIAGDPSTLDYDLRRMPQLWREHKRMVGSFMRALLGAGMLPFQQAIPLQGTAHAAGTLVCGDDPARSVVDRWGQVHGMANLYVADGSVLPRLGRMNPALSIYAWGLRLGDRLARG